MSQNVSLPWELKVEMFRQTAKNAEMDYGDNYNELFLSLFYGIGFGTPQDLVSMTKWSIKAGSHGSSLAKAVVSQFSDVSGHPLGSSVPISDWLIEAVESLMGTRDLESIACAVGVLREHHTEAYRSAQSVYREKMRILSLVRMTGSTNQGPKLWETPSNVRAYVIDKIKAQHRQPNDVLRVACIEGDLDLVRATINVLQAEVDAVYEHGLGGTPIMSAIENGHYELAKQLITEFHSNVHFDITDQYDRNALIVASESPFIDEPNHLDLCRLILQLGEYTTNLEALADAVKIAAINRNVALSILLIQMMDKSLLSGDNFHTLARVLLHNHSHEALDYLLSKVPAESRLSPSSKLLWFACTVPPMMCWVSHGSRYFENILSLLNVLKNQGMMVFDLSDEHPSPLLAAVVMGHTDLVRELIVLGADPMLPEPAANNASPFLAAIGADFSNPPAFKIMLDQYKGSIPPPVSISAIVLASLSRPFGLEFVQTLHDGNCIDILNLCGPHSNVLHQVILHGFDVEPIIFFLVSKGAVVDSLDSDGVTPLWCAIKTQKLGVVRILLQGNASVTLSGPNGQTSLHAAAALDDNGQVLGLLLNETCNTSDPNVRNEEGFTPLHCAAESANAGAVQALLIHKADPALRDKGGKTPLDVARETLANAFKLPVLRRHRKEFLCRKIIETLKQEIQN